MGPFPRATRQATHRWMWDVRTTIDAFSVCWRQDDRRAARLHRSATHRARLYCVCVYAYAARAHTCAKRVNGRLLKGASES